MTITGKEKERTMVNLARIVRPPQRDDESTHAYTSLNLNLGFSF
jgi:hypothetical protein